MTVPDYYTQALLAEADIPAFLTRVAREAGERGMTWFEITRDAGEPDPKPVVVKGWRHRPDDPGATSARPVLN